MADNRAIGVFDSGVGGLSVLQALHAELPRESTIYVGDLARCPYGIRPQREVRDFAIQIGDFLVDQDIKLLVVACNTAAAAAYEELQSRCDIPVVGVIEPAVRAAIELAPGGCIGVIATDGTVGSGAYSRAISILDREASVIERSASWLVPMIERGAIARAQVALELAPVLEEMGSHSIDVLILGCTHFPLVRDIFEAEASPGIYVLDSAATTAQEVVGGGHAPAPAKEQEGRENQQPPPL
ncbi:MAG: glutamate racemase, partial [Chloroflexota bacterium]